MVRQLGVASHRTSHVTKGLEKCGVQDLRARLQAAGKGTGQKEGETGDRRLVRRHHERPAEGLCWCPQLERRGGGVGGRGMSKAGRGLSLLGRKGHLPEFTVVRPRDYEFPRIAKQLRDDAMA